MVASTEVCDDGENNGAGYGFCTTDCTPGPRCGDGTVDVGPDPDNPLEQCDNGINGDGYYSEEDDCAPGCVYPPFCGDAQVDAAFAEQCDNGYGYNNGQYGGCNADCTLGPRCGDGILETGLDAEGNPLEECDDGNRSNNDGCSVACKEEPRFTAK
jgi:cysteine-rich repeat protein